MSLALVRFPERGAPRSIAERSIQNAGTSGLANPAQWLIDILGGMPARSGVIVTAETAMRCLAVFACVKVLAETMAQLPLSVHRRRANGGADEDTAHSLYPILHDAPNQWQTSFEWREMAMGHTALRGNAYSYISRDHMGRVLELLPLHPDRVTVRQLPDWSVEYTIARPGGSALPAKPGEILHLAGLSSNGVTGVSPIAQAREAVGLSLAAEMHGAQLFGNGARPGGVLTHPKALSDPARENLKKTWQVQHGGENRLGTAILEEGMEWKQLGMTSEDAQFLETRKYQRAEIASLFRVPPHMIGDLERATFSNIEHQSIAFVVHTMMPWVKRWEQRLNRQLLSSADRKTHFVRFNVDGLLRGDTQTRYAAYGVAITNGWMSRNEVRALEGLNAADGLDAYLTPLNMDNGAKAPASKETGNAKAP